MLRVLGKMHYVPVFVLWNNKYHQNDKNIKLIKSGVKGNWIEQSVWRADERVRETERYENQIYEITGMWTIRKYLNTYRLSCNSNIRESHNWVTNAHVKHFQTFRSRYNIPTHPYNRYPQSTKTEFYEEDPGTFNFRLRHN